MKMWCPRGVYDVGFNLNFNFLIVFHVSTISSFNFWYFFIEREEIFNKFSTINLKNCTSRFKISFFQTHHKKIFLSNFVHDRITWQNQNNSYLISNWHSLPIPSFPHCYGISPSHHPLQPLLPSSAKRY